jgi:hypothetical protein
VKRRGISSTATAPLAAAGIHTLDDLRNVGVISAYNLVKCQGYNATLNLLRALTARVNGVREIRVPGSEKQRLKQRR